MEYVIDTTIPSGGGSISFTTVKLDYSITGQTEDANVQISDLAATAVLDETVTFNLTAGTDWILDSDSVKILTADGQTDITSDSQVSVTPAADGATAECSFKMGTQDVKVYAKASHRYYV